MKIHRGGAENAEKGARAMHINELTEIIIAAAIEVHRALGPGLLQSSYQTCLRRELELRGIQCEHELPLPLLYKGVKLDCGYRIDLLVAGLVVVEAKSVVSLEKIHEAQLLTYLRLGGWKVGLLIIFNVALLKDGIKRRVLGLKE